MLLLQKHIFVSQTTLSPTSLLNKDGENTAAAEESNDDSLFGSSSDEEEFSSEEGQDDEEPTDLTAALGFIKSLGMDVDISDESVDECARSHYEDGAKCIAGRAAAASSGILPSSSYILGYKIAVISLNESASGGNAGVDLWVPVFRIILEQARREFKVQWGFGQRKLQLPTRQSRQL